MKSFTIGVLSPYLEGNYFGKLLHGIHELCNQYHIKLIAVRTADDFNQYNYPLALNHVDGWIVITDAAASEDLLNKLQQSGKSIVGISGGFNSTFSFPLILTDNQACTVEAVHHLADHGHRYIAFAGSFQTYDVIQRYEGYCHALRERSIPLNPELVFRISDDGNVGGQEAAKYLLELTEPCTAIVTGTDYNAILLIEKLRENGYRVPEDFAVIGYDDVNYAKINIPSLTTIKQNLEEMSRMAVLTLLKLLNGEQVGMDNIYVNSSLVIRRSCGCISDAGEDNYFAEVQKSKQIIDFLGNTIRSNEAIGGHLIKANSEEIVNLSWLLSANITWGCLGLWKTDMEQSRELIVNRYINNRGDQHSSLGIVCSAENFPPIELLHDSSDIGEDNILTLSPIRTESREWGILALIEPMDKDTYSYDTSTLYFDLFASALERESLYEEVKEREQRYREIAEQLEIVSRTTNDGIWEWNLETDHVEWNERIHNILGTTKETLQSVSHGIFGLIHPHELHYIQTMIAKHFNENIPFHSEFRMRRHDGSYLWVYAAGEAIRDAYGKPVRMIGSIRDITERKQFEEQITFLAYHDSLTELPNRLLFYERLTDSIAQAAQFRHKLAVLVFDLDRFKMINDSYGHHAGDKLLKFVAEQLKQHIPAVNTMARLGGDEFTLLMPHIADEDEAAVLGRSILELLKQPFVYDSIEFFITGSLGISIYPNHGEDADTLMKTADIAMYRAKAEGKNKVELYTTSMDEWTKSRFFLENDLRKAITRGEFVLSYQPQIHLHSGTIYGVEALVRWNSPERGLISPLEFIPLAEETGLIVPIGYWVLQEACKQHKIWMDMGYSPLKIAVNISARQFKQPDFLGQFKNILKQTDLDPTMLCIELTESTAMENIDFITAVLDELIQLGVHISMDDFGTGYSSLALLKRLPIDIVKIDKAFINHMTEDGDDAAIVQAMIAMSHSIGLKVIAEGVETKEQAALLEHMGCGYIQGYYFSKPVSNHDVINYLEKSPR